MTSQNAEGHAPIDLEDYAAFIQQIELRDLWLDNARINNRVGPTLPDALTVTISTELSRWEPVSEGFRAFRAYSLAIRTSNEHLAAEIEVTFGVEFSSTQVMSDDLFEVFSETNLHINTWPYLREFVHSAVGRMGWPPLTLPAVKVGTPAPAPGPETTTQPVRPSRTRRAKVAPENPS